MDIARQNMMGPEDWGELRHFTKKEFSCKCGACGRTWMNRDFVFRLDSLRARVGFPVVITSGYRCETHNKAIGGATNSQHVKGLAVDLKITSSGQRYEMLKEIFSMHFAGVGIADNFVHIDDRTTNLVSWTY